MRILVATCHRNLVGGIERYLQVLIPGLLSRGHQLALLHEVPFNPAGESVDPAEARLTAWCASPENRTRALTSVAQWRPEIVYCQGLEDGELEGALLDAYPVVLYAHNYYGKCISGRKSHRFPVTQPCSRRFGGMCLLLFYPRRCGGLNPATMFQMYRRQSQIAARLPGFQSILVASRHMLQEFQNNGVEQDRVQLVPLAGVEKRPEFIALRQDIQKGNILFVGRMTNLKGADYLVKAVAHAAKQLTFPLRLTLAGDGPELGKVRGLAKALGVIVQYAGWVDIQQRLELMQEAALVAVPSLWPEPFGLVGIEAGSVSLPAVGYATGGISDWLIPGVTGELAPADPPTPEGLGDAIVRALADRDHYGRLRQGAWEMAQRFTLDAHLDRLEPIFLRAAAESHQSES